MIKELLLFCFLSVQVGADGSIVFRVLLKKLKALLLGENQELHLGRVFSSLNGLEMINPEKKRHFARDRGVVRQIRANHRQDPLVIIHL